MWKHTKNYLKKFSVISGGNKEGKKQVVSDAILKHTNIDVPIENIKCYGGCVFINTNPTIKSEILFKKAEIIQTLNKTYGGTDIINIR
jgi:hypothetical protein